MRATIATLQQNSFLVFTFTVLKMKIVLAFVALICATTAATTTTNPNGASLSGFLTNLNEGLTNLKEGLMTNLKEGFENLLDMVRSFATDQSTQIEQSSK